MPDFPGTSESLWLAEPAPPPRDPYSGGDQVDVAVIGGGIVGAMSALELAQSGVRVVLAEARRVAEGVTAHSTAKVTALHATQYSQISSLVGSEAAEAYGALNLDGVAMVSEVAYEHSIECSLETAPNYIYAED